MSIYTDPVHLAAFRSQVEESTAPPGPFGPCQQWTGSLRDGYGVIRIGRRTIRAHRFAYHAAHGPIHFPHLDHLCHSADPRCRGGATCPHRSCVNADHLEPVTPFENTRRSRERPSVAPTCPNGHDWMTNTLYDTAGRRYCYDCIAGAY